MDAIRVSADGSAVKAQDAPQRVAQRAATSSATRELARCPSCGGLCGGKHREPDEAVMETGQRALRRAVLARRQHKAGSAAV